MAKYQVFRNDDVSVTTDIGLLLRTHEAIEKAGRIHTVAVEMCDLWKNKEIWFFLQTARNLEVCLHGWEHSEYWRMTKDQCLEDIRKSLDYWKSMTERGGYRSPPIKKFLPPWNKIGPGLLEACQIAGLELDARVGPPVYNFHSWEFIDRNRLSRLEEALHA
ncbi:MAG: hypothetical protein IT428_17225 [Planctomycetaceae bacterium]|nr:hypothetical protein [Planctomycetaceae bacterium]